MEVCSIKKKKEKVSGEVPRNRKGKGGFKEILQEKEARGQRQFPENPKPGLEQVLEPRKNTLEPKESSLPEEDEQEKGKTEKVKEV